MKWSKKIFSIMVAVILMVSVMPVTSYAAVDYNHEVDHYKIPATFGTPQYSAAEIQKMIDCNLTLDEVAEKIATISDLIQYLYMKGFGPSDAGDLNLSDGTCVWSYNRSAQIVFDENEGNCGGVSNLANYILKGDYDAQGYVQEMANEGGHVYNYFQQEGDYCFIDFTCLWRPDKNYSVYVTDNPAKYSSDYIENNHSHYSSRAGHHLLIQWMYELDGNHLPLGLYQKNGQKTVLGYPFSDVLPLEYKSVLKTLYLEKGYSEPEFHSIEGLNFDFNPEKLLEEMEFGCSAEKINNGKIQVCTTKVPSSISQLYKDGYTIRYKFYRSAKKSSGYKCAVTKSKGQCIFTSGTKGTRYYFKVRITATKNGVTYSTRLKNCKYSSIIK